MKKGNEIIKERKALPRTGKARLPKKITWLKQPNLITLMSCDLTTLQIRAVVTIIEKLQDDINARIGGSEIKQLSLFKENEDIIKFYIAVREFGESPDRYGDVREAIKGLTNIPVEIAVQNPETGAATFNTTLFSAHLPIEGAQNKKIIIEINKHVAKCLVDTDKGFTKFVKEIAFASKKKYTVRMYMLISSWKDRGGFSITVENFKKWLKIEDKYTDDFKSLYRRVIRPAYEELHENADCWFEVAEVYEMGENQPYKLNFKIVKATTLAEQNLLQANEINMRHILVNNLRLSVKQANQIVEKINKGNYMRVRDKLIEVYDYVQQNLKTINKVPEYVHTALLNFIKDIDKEELTDVTEVE